MTDDRLPSRSGAPTFIKKIGPLLLIISSVFIGVVLVELISYLFGPPITNKFFRAAHEVVFFEGRDSIFQNHGDIYTYVPHDEIRNVTGFMFDNGFNVEYDYRFRTNDLGLVQDADVMPGKASILLLGDSFTEGQGAAPWFRLVSPEIDKLGYQAINGGLMGTGFEQWLQLERYLAAKNVRIQKVVVVFISDDYRRRVWNFPPAVFRCLSALRLCRVEDNYLGVYRLPPEEELSSWIARIRATRGTMTKIWIKGRAEALLPASFQIYEYFASIGRSNGAEEQSRAAIAELLKIYGPENVTFIHLPEKGELNGPTDFGLKVRRSIQEAGGKLFDGFKLCRLTAADYYANDTHPNSRGYAKIALCVTNIIKEVTAGVQ